MKDCTVRTKYEQSGGPPLVGAREQPSWPAIEQAITSAKLLLEHI